MRKNGKYVKCKVCKKEFYAHLCSLKMGKGKFCSQKCSGISKKGKPSWNKGKKLSKQHKQNLSEARKGKHYSPTTEFKKGQKAWNKGKKCPHLIGKNNPNWNGGKYHNHYGYVLVRVHKHPFSDHYGYVREHRLVMEKHLKRYLKPRERVHHINGIRDDNRIKNLKLFSNDSEHQKHHNPNRKKFWLFRRNLNI